MNKRLVHNSYFLATKITTTKPNLLNPKPIQHTRIRIQLTYNFTEKDNKPVDSDGSQTYTDEKLSEIIDQSLSIMDADLDGYVSFPEFVKTQQDMKQSAGH